VVRGGQTAADDGRDHEGRDPGATRPADGTPVAGAVDPALVDAVVFDMDGVVTRTARVHAAAWKRLFDDYLRERSRRDGMPFRPFDVETDYLPFVDGKPRQDGVRDFLASREVALPYGDPADPADADTVCGLGNRKNEYFLRAVAEHGAEAFPDAVRFVGRLHRHGIDTAIISASDNVDQVLAAAGAASLFSATITGLDAGRLHLPGKPDPAVFLEAARRLGAQPARAVVVEDALAGVRAGRAGGFGLVIGVDRTRPESGHGADLAADGADVVVRSLDEIAVD